MKGENRQEEYLKLNPSGQMPALILDDGTAVAETVAICEYLDPKLENVNAWFARVARRPSAEGSLHPVAKAGGMRA